MKNTTPILVLTGLAIVAAAGIAGLTREQWLGQPTPAVATQDTAPAEAPASSAETAAPAAPAAPAAETAATEQPAAEQPEQTAAVQPEAPAETAVQPEAPAETAVQPETPAETAVQPEAPAETAAQPETEAASNAAEKPEVPAFDTVRVEKTGEAVIAGRAEAGSDVVIKFNGQEIGKTVANPDGAFVVVPEQPLPAGSGAITIEATGKGDLSPVASEESVAVIVPEGQPQQALVAVVSPDAPTKVLQKPEAPAEEQTPAEAVAAEQPAPEQPAPEQPAPEQPAQEQQAAEQTPAKLVSIDAVDYDPTGNIVFSGQGEDGNTARIYVDNTFLGDAPVGVDGRWTFSGTADVSQGVHTLRVDGLDGQGNVVNRIEVPFFREDRTRVAEVAQPAAPEAEQPAAAVEPAQQEQPPQEPEAASTELPETAEAPSAAVEQQQPAAEQPAAEQPAAGQPAAEQPAAAQPAEPEEPAASQTAEAPEPVVPQPDAAPQAEETVAATAAPEAASPATPTEGRIVIQPGNNLWRISRVLYGTGNKFTMLYEANKDQIRNPNLIYPGQVFRTPDVAPKAESIDPGRRDPLKPDENAAGAQ